LLTGERDSGRRRHDAELLSRVVDHTNLAHPDALVDAHPIVTFLASRPSVESDNCLL
jgi:hypothetical protein